MRVLSIKGGPTHRVPEDLGFAIKSNKAASKIWADIITPLAKDEWICWTISVKKQATRDDHVRRVVESLLAGKRRPCCWAGCVHRKK